MVELIRVEPAGERALDLTFSDGSRGRWTLGGDRARHGADAAAGGPCYFARAFLEAGALA